MEAGPVTDWAIQYGKEPCLWARTAKAWYRLMAPSHAYTATAALMQRRLDMCTRIVSALVTQGEGLTYEAGVSAARQVRAGRSNASGPLGGPSWDCFTSEDVRQEAGFIYQQLVAWAKVGSMERESFEDKKSNVHSI